MLIGSDFDKIEFSFLGLDLLEPNAFIGDTLILITAITLGYKTKKINKHLPVFINWNFFFWWFGIGMFLGGSGPLMFT